MRTIWSWLLYGLGEALIELTQATSGAL